ncbi:DinB family protein [Peribacillus kribbensis]|uniref:DinB family protein n=1 Tax=Peribacillus kribbensis TaxID=356658 RepID=UPI000419BFF3|nr:DinB family protein [Peribacillus kribbensis]
MFKIFLYNWQVREDWFSWCEKIPLEELTKKRHGGMGSFLHNLFHVIDCEQIWVNQMLGKPVLQKDTGSVPALEEVKDYSGSTRSVTMDLLNSHEGFEEKFLNLKRKDGSIDKVSYIKVLSHIASHEVHHIGQLSVWAREMGMKPVSSDLIFRT